MTAVDPNILDTKDREARRALFVRYASALPFSMPREHALREVVARSLAREHHWRARDCDTTDAVSPG